MLCVELTFCSLTGFSRKGASRIRPSFSGGGGQGCMSPGDRVLKGVKFFTKTRYYDTIPESNDLFFNKMIEFRNIFL